jgi:hypothetical protein
MVLDCGGGTVDITMHQVENLKPMRLSEVCLCPCLCVCVSVCACVCDIYIHKHTQTHTHTHTHTHVYIGARAMRRPVWLQVCR